MAMEKTSFEDEKLDLASTSPVDTTVLSWTVEEETRIRRKLDRNIVPLVTLLYLLCFIDR